MALAFPDAPIFAIVYSEKTGPKSIATRVRPSWLQRVPRASERHRLFFPLFPAAVESFDLSSYDVILSSHHTAAKGLLRGGDQVHVCYCHTPMRAIWERSEAELQSLPSIARPFASAVFAGYRIWDYTAAARVDLFVANSGVTQRRIKKHYGRDSVILAPPIDVERFTIGVPERQETDKYYLVASRPVPYKRVDIAVGACLEMGRRVVVAGGNHKGLPKDPRVIQLGSVDDGSLLKLMRGAEALLFPQEEDFGMTPLEMNACGRPTIAYGAGGALETVVDGETGVLVANQDVRSFAEGIARLERLTFEPERLREHALSFSQDAFIGKLRDVVLQAWTERRG